ncbi:DUF3368 domain-containing protein [Candidatus Merdisoma sp. JLR.KK006]|uniref:DUF3368 domain-containing protein n=1 Tax=Candidatus Merdisoma sp. JLR.KK006 TaxID=3112626 RepID=UPI002FF23E26
MIVISDTTPILSLLKAGKLDLLKILYQKVVVPEAVYDELTANADYEDERKAILHCSFLSVEKVSNAESVNILRNVTGLDAGESESLILYGEKKADLLLLDERKGRGVAKKMSVQYVGTLGVLMQAFDEGIVTAEEIRKILEILLASDIRLSRKLCNKVLDYVGQENFF